MNVRRSNDRLLDDEDIGDLGVFAFAKRSAVLLVPMGIVASVFGLWLRGELLSVRKDFSEAIVHETRMMRNEMISRSEFEDLKRRIDERWAQETRSAEEQNRMIQKNTVYLERIGQKLGIQRPVE